MQVEALRKMVAGVQAELEQAIASAGLRVKFELLHDEAPQVHTLKAYMEQVELSMTRAQERVGEWDFR
jgi:capsule polysaccharide export protein KpsE/RkpR